MMLAGCNLLSGAGDLVTGDAIEPGGGEAGVQPGDRDATTPPPGVDGASDSSSGADGGDGGDGGANVDASVTRPDGGRFVFVTSTTSSGNLGGAAGGDARCNTLASQAGLGGTWGAWLSAGTANGDAVDRVGSGPWYLVDGTFVAGSKSQLAQDVLDHAIDRDESGAPVVGQRVWTGTRNGTLYFGDCNGWTAGSQAEPGTVGTTAAKGNRWTADTPIGCQSSSRLYCFEK